MIILENINIFGDVLFHKPIDWSIFEWGTTIPVSKVELFDQIIGHHTKRGTHIEIKLLVEGKMYDAKLINVDRKKVKSDTYQIRYDSNNSLKVLLKNICISVFEEIKHQRDDAIKKGNKKPYVIVSERNNYIEFLATSEPRIFSLRVNLEDFYEIESDEFISEIIAKQIINKKTTGLSDEKLDERRKKRLSSYKEDNQKKKEFYSKVHLSNPILKEDIKQLYSYKCQICSIQIKYKGWIPGLTKNQEYYFLSADAHHIVALSDKGKDDPSNLICVCPNCHRKLHTGELEILFDNSGPKCLNSITKKYIELNIDKSHSLKTRYCR